MRPDLLGFAWALLVLSAGLAAPGEDGPTVDLRAIPGFEGRILNPFRFPLVIEIENGLQESLRGDLVIARESGATASIASDIEAPPETNVRRRVTVELPSGSPGAASLEVSFTARSFTHSALVLPELGDPGAIIAVHESRGHVYLPLRTGSRSIAVKPCRPAYLPADAFAYDRVLAVLLSDADPARWEIEQAKALDEYVRRGGLVILEGGERGKALAFSPIVSFWTAGQGRPIAAPEVGEFADAFPLGLGTVLRSRINVAANLGRLISPAAENKQGERESLDPLASARGLFQDPEIASHEFPFGGFMLALTKELGSRARQSPPMGALPLCLGYFLLFVVCLLVAVLRSLRSRRGGLRPVLALGTVTAAFALPVPLLIAALGREPCPTSVFRTIRYGPEGAGVECLAAAIRSTGGKGVRLAIAGRNLVAYDMTAQAGGVRGLFVHVRPPLRHASELSLDLPMQRWEGAAMLALSDSPGPPPLEIRAFLAAEMLYVRVRKDPRHEGRIRSRAEVETALDGSRQGPLAWMLRRRGDPRFWTGIGVGCPRIWLGEVGPPEAPADRWIASDWGFGTLVEGESRIFAVPLTDRYLQGPLLPDVDPESVPEGPPPERCARRGWVLLSYWADTPSQAMAVGGGIRIEEEACLVQQVVPIEEEME